MRWHFSVFGVFRGSQSVVVVLFLFQFAHDEFGGGQKLFVVVAFLTAGHAVAFNTFSSADNRQHMIHRQFFRLKAVSAIIADSFSKLLFPPGAFAQFFGFSPFPFHVYGVFFNINPVVAHCFLQIQYEELKRE